MVAIYPSLLLVENFEGLYSFPLFCWCETYVGLLSIPCWCENCQGLLVITLCVKTGKGCYLSLSTVGVKNVKECYPSLSSALCVKIGKGCYLSFAGVKTVKDCLC